MSLPFSTTVPAWAPNCDCCDTKEQPMKTNHGVERQSWSRRPHFTPRQRLTAEQLNTGLLDEINRQRIINQALHGFGVVMGYGLTVLDDGILDLRHGQLEISDGLALDRYGRMLVWKRACVGMSDLVGPQPKEAGSYTLVAHYAVRSPEADDCPEPHGTQSLWTEESVVFSLRPGCKEQDCGCPEHPSERCVSHGEYLNRRNGGLPGKSPSVAPSPDVRWLGKKPHSRRASCDRGWEYDLDPRVGVPLACLEICDLATDHGRTQDAVSHDVADDCEPRWGFCPDSKPDTIQVRPLVYRNPLLYELTRCCDVDAPRVKEISWQDWVNRGWNGDKPVSWNDFAGVLRDPDEGFVVTFTKPVDPATLHEASFFLTAYYRDSNNAWRSYRIPANCRAPEGHGGKGDVVQLIPDQVEWLPSEVTGNRSHLFHKCRIEVTIRGQLIHDECGRMLDARPIGRECDTSCQARPGGDFVTVFKVAARHGDQQAPARPTAETTIAQHVTEEAGE
jgi:hypothetical protein